MYLFFRILFIIQFVFILAIAKFSFGIQNDSIEELTPSQDSLLNNINASNDVRSVSIDYAQLAESFKHSDPDKAKFYANKGLVLSTENSFRAGMAENFALLGDIYVSENQLDSARANYSRALVLFKELEKSFDYAQLLMIIGNINLAQNRYVDAQSSYLQALEVVDEEDINPIKAHLYNNLGVLYMDIEDYDDSKKYFEVASQTFLEAGDEFNANVSSANVYRILAIEGKQQEAIEGYLDLVSYFLKIKNWEYVAHGYNAVAIIHLENGAYTDAVEFVQLALTTIETNAEVFEGPSAYYKADIYTTSARIYFQLEKKELAKHYALLGYQLSQKNSFTKNSFECAQILYSLYTNSGKLDSALFYSKAYIETYSNYEQDRDIKQITQLKMQREFAERTRSREIAMLKREAESKRREIIYAGALIIAVLIGIILFIQNKNQKIKTDRADILREKLELERERLSQELNYKNKELATNMMYLLEKNEFIASITEKLVQMRSKTKKSNLDLIQEIIMELKRNSSQKIWEEFELRFKEVHSDFYNALNERFPDLSPNEIRLCAFLRLNMSTKEISAITHQSVKSINMARFRLRKKLQMDQDENLISYLAQL